MQNTIRGPPRRLVSSQFYGGCAAITCRRYCERIVRFPISMHFEARDSSLTLGDTHVRAQVHARARARANAPRTFPRRDYYDQIIDEMRAPPVISSQQTVNNLFSPPSARSGRDRKSLGGAPQLEESVE